MCALVRQAGGAAAVEFAIVLPVLLAVLLGICVYGLYLGARHNLNELTAAAGRASVAGLSDTERAALARQRVKRALSEGSIFAPGTVNVEIVSDAADPNLYRVTLSADARALGLSGFSSLLPVPSDTLRSSVSIRRGGL